MSASARLRQPTAVGIPTAVNIPGVALRRRH